MKMRSSIKSANKKPFERSSKERNLTQPVQTQSDIYQRITDKILADLEKGNLTWRKPWNSEHLEGKVMRPLRWNNIPYTGINTLVLWGTAADQGYSHAHWMTYNQAIELKAAIRKGEKGTQIVYADKITVEKDTPEGKTELSNIPFLKTYSVFNVSQIEGLPEKFYQTPEVPTVNACDRIDKLEKFFAETKADIYRGNEASYNQSRGRIQMPPFESFESAPSYYATLAHELTHWTKHPKRLDRDLGRKTYGDEGYAKEELVAELGACFLAADLGFEPMPEEKHSAYIQSWLEALKVNKKFIFSAASLAEKSTTYIHNLQLKTK